MGLVDSFVICLGRMSFLLIECLPWLYLIFGVGSKDGRMRNDEKNTFFSLPGKAWDKGLLCHMGLPSFHIGQILMHHTLKFMLFDMHSLMWDTYNDNSLCRELPCVLRAFCFIMLIWQLYSLCVKVLQIMK